MDSPYVTVFTPTYNRAHTLRYVYESLLNQTLRDFEWLIVDDGSDDDTARLVARWRDEAPFPIRYIYQENRGKHVATNLGVREARGYFFLFLDSDDSCVPEALQTFAAEWRQIPEHERDRYSTLSALCMSKRGDVVGSEYPSQIVDATTAAEQWALRSGGERFGINRTDVLRHYPFPEFSGEKFVPESLVWNRMARQYRTRFMNVPLRIYEQRADGLTASSVRIRANSPRGACLYYKEVARLGTGVTHRAKALVNMLRFSLHARQSMIEMIRGADQRSAALLLLPLGALLYWLDRRRL